MGPAPLPCRFGQHRGDGGLDAAVGVGDDELHPGQTPGHEGAQKCRPLLLEVDVVAVASGG